MTKSDVHRVIKRFRGALTWAAGELEVSKGTLCKWLWNENNIPALDRKFARVEQLAQDLVDSKGSCMARPSARSVVELMRRNGNA